MGLLFVNIECSSASLTAYKKTSCSKRQGFWLNVLQLSRRKPLALYHTASKIVVYYFHWIQNVKCVFIDSFVFSFLLLLLRLLATTSTKYIGEKKNTGNLNPGVCLGFPPTGYSYWLRTWVKVSWELIELGLENVSCINLSTHSQYNALSANLLAVNTIEVFKSYLLVKNASCNCLSILTPLPYLSLTA